MGATGGDPMRRTDDLAAGARAHHQQQQQSLLPPIINAPAAAAATAGAGVGEKEKDLGSSGGVGGSTGFLSPGQTVTQAALRIGTSSNQPSQGAAAGGARRGSRGQEMNDTTAL